MYHISEIWLSEDLNAHLNSENYAHLHQFLRESTGFLIPNLIQHPRIQEVLEFCDKIIHFHGLRIIIYCKDPSMFILNGLTLKKRIDAMKVIYNKIIDLATNHIVLTTLAQNNPRQIFKKSETTLEETIRDMELSIIRNLEL